MELPTTVCAEFDLVLKVGSTDCSDVDLDRKVSPPNEEVVGDEVGWTVSMVPLLMAEGGDRVLLGDRGDVES
jgi:hypothetical protein